MIISRVMGSVWVEVYASVYYDPYLIQHIPTFNPLELSVVALAAVQTTLFLREYTNKAGFNELIQYVPVS